MEFDSFKEVQTFIRSFLGEPCEDIDLIDKNLSRDYTSTPPVRGDAGDGLITLNQGKGNTARHTMD